MSDTLDSTAVATGLGLLLVPAFGILGAAVAAATAVVLVDAVTLLLVHRLLGFWPYGARCAKPVIAGLLAAVSIYLIRLILYTDVPALLVFAPLFLAVFLALLVALGLSLSNRQFLALVAGSAVGWAESGKEILSRV